MRILIAEDDLASRKYINSLLASYGECDLTVDGIEAIEAFVLALDQEKPYHLLVLDVMMPKVDGIKALKTIQDLEALRDIPKENRVKTIITTALAETSYIKNALTNGNEIYLSKPIESHHLNEALKLLKLI